MFFKKRKTEIDNDFDDDDDFDDFGLEDSGFNDATPNTGLRGAVTTIRGGFFSGLKTSALDPRLHRKVLKKSFPDGYDSHYDDARSILAESKSIYNTASEEANKLGKAYASELNPTIKQWNEKKNSKLSNKLAEMTKVEQSSNGNDVPEMSEERMQTIEATNNIFGNTIAQATSDGIQSLNEESVKSNAIDQGLQKQSNEILTVVANGTNKANAFNEQVALKWKKKTLEIQFKQYFTARKQLDIQTQSHEYMQAVLPNIVKNTGLPDAVKVKASEVAMQMFTQGTFNKLTKAAGAGFNEILGDFGNTARTKIVDYAQQAAGSSGMFGSMLNMFDTSEGFGQSPKDMILEAIGGFAASQGAEYLIDKSTGMLKDKIDESDVDFERKSEQLKLFKAQLPAILKNVAQNGTGVDMLDTGLRFLDIEKYAGGRNTTIQSSMASRLDEQALFNLETQKSITLTIPRLLSEIHGEVRGVRSGLGYNEPDPEDSLRMDWVSGRLNTTRKIRQNVEDNLFSKAKKDEARSAIYELLEELGFDKEQIEKDHDVKRDGKVLLSETDLNYLTIAFKAASYDRSQFFDIADLARGSSLITNEEARYNIAKFFTDSLQVSQDIPTLEGSSNLISSYQDYIDRQQTHEITIQRKTEETLSKLNKQGISAETIENAVRAGNVEDFVKMGVVTLDDKGNYTIDPRALSEHGFTKEITEARPVEDRFSINTNDIYGIEERNRQRLDEIRRRQEKKEKEEEAKAAEAAARAEERGDMSLFERARSAVSSAGDTFSTAQSQLSETANNLGSMVFSDEEMEVLKKNNPLSPYADKIGKLLNQDLSENRFVIKGRELTEDAKSKAKELSDKAARTVTLEDGRVVLYDRVMGLKDGTPEYLKNIVNIPKKEDSDGFDETPEQREEIKRQLLENKRMVDAIDDSLPGNIIYPGGKKPRTYQPGAINDIGADPAIMQRSADHMHRTGHYASIDRGGNGFGWVPPTEAGKMAEASYMRWLEGRKDDNINLNISINGNPVDDDDDIVGPDNYYNGGIVGLSSGHIANFASGGRPRQSSQQLSFGKRQKQNQLESSINRNKTPTRNINLKLNSDLFGDTGKTKEEIDKDKLIAGINKSFEREEAAGGKPVLATLSEGEIVIPKEKVTQWKQFERSNPLSPAFSEGHFSEAIDAKEKSLRDSLDNLTGELKKTTTQYSQMAKERFSGLREDFSEAFGGFKQKDDFVGPMPQSKFQAVINKAQSVDVDKAKDSASEKFENIKEAYDAKMDAFKDLLTNDEGKFTFGSGLSIPNLSSDTKPISTLSHQLSEMIRLSGLIAINTGSEPGDIEAPDPSLIAPFDAGPSRLSQSVQKTKGFFSKIKNKFSSDKEEHETGDKVKISTWAKMKNKLPSRKKEDKLFDLYHVDFDEPIITGRDMAAGKYFDAESGNKLTHAYDIKGSVINEHGRVVLQWSDFADGKIQIKGASKADQKEFKKSLKQKGLLRRSAGALLGLTWSGTKATGRGILNVGKGTLWSATKMGQGIGWAGRGLFGNVEETHDVYLEGVKKPVMLARDMANGMYLDKETGKPVLDAKSINGAVLDLNGNFVITEDDFNNRRVIIHTNEGREALLVKGLKTSASLTGTLGMFAGKGVIGALKLPYKIATMELTKKIKTKSDDLIDADIYVKGDPNPRIRMQLIGQDEYFDESLEPLLRYSQLKDGVYDKDANLILSQEDIKKGLTSPDGTPLTKLLGLTGNIIGGTLKGAFNLTSGLFKLAGKAFGGMGRLATGFGSALWSKLSGRGFDVDGVDKYALMIQAQAASVDRLEAIRIILDERMEKNDAAHNDKDGDGERDGGYLDQLRKRAARKKEKEEKKKQKAEEKKANEEKDGDSIASQITQGISGFFSKGLLFSVLGGLVAANFGPQIATGIFSGIRTVLPSWLGGYSDEKKSQIAANGGTISHMMQTGSAAAENADGQRIQPTLDEDGNVVPGEEGSGLGFGTKAALGVAGVSLLPKAVGALGKGLIKTPGLIGKGIRLASNKTGLTGKLGLSGMGKWQATKKIVGSTVKGAGKFMRWAGRGGMGTALRALPALATTPVGLAVIGIAAAGAVIYGGYKLYKHLTAKDNHLTTFRMAQYGYDIKSKEDVTRLFNLEQYLAKYTHKATASTPAKISTQTETREVLKIFGIAPNIEEDVNTFFDWYYYRFKPVYLTWKTLMMRAIGNDDLSKVDEMLFIADKLEMIDAASFNREQQNPYNTPTSPIPGVESLEMTHDLVLDVQDKVVKSLSRINAEKHDDKVRRAGGGTKKQSDDGTIIDKMTNSDTMPTITAKQREAEARARIVKEKQEKRREERNKRAKQEQSFMNRFLFGKNRRDDERGGWGDPWGMGQKGAEWVKDKLTGLFSSPGGEGGTYDASSKTLNLSDQDIIDLTKVTSTEVAAHLKGSEYNNQAGAIVDTIINRVASKAYPDTVRGVINQRSQFSAISGNPDAYGSVQNMPDSAVKSGAASFVPSYIKARIAGEVQPVINGDLHYLNPAHSGKTAMNSWGKVVIAQAEKSGQIYGSGDSKHYHGTSTEAMKQKPFGFKLAYGSQTSKPQNTSKKASSNSIMGPNSIPTTSGTNKNSSSSVPPLLAKPTTNASSNYSSSSSSTKNSDSIMGGSLKELTKGVKPKEETGERSLLGKVADGFKAVTSSLGSGGSDNGTSKKEKQANKPDYTGVVEDTSNNLAGAPWMNVAKTQLGLNEDKDVAAVQAYHAVAAKQPSWDPRKYPWCASFIGWCLAKAEVEYPITARAADYSKYGKTISKTKIPYGAILVIKFSTGNHVSFCIEDLGDRVKTIGGNQKGLSSKPGSTERNGGEVTISSVKKSNITAVVYPTKYSPVAGGVNNGYNFDNAGGAGTARYQMDIGKALQSVKDRQAKRKELSDATKRKFVAEEVKLGFEGGRGRAEIGTRADKSNVRDGFNAVKAIKKVFNLPSSELTPVDMTPSGYESTGRKPVPVETKPDTSDEVKSKVPTKTQSVETPDVDTTALDQARKAREALEKQNEAQLKRIRKLQSKEVVSESERQVLEKRKQKQIETDSEVYKKQLEVQIEMAKDIRRMADTINKIYETTTVSKPKGNAKPVKSEERKLPPAELNRHTRTIATAEPVSMKIR